MVEGKTEGEREGGRWEERGSKEGCVCKMGEKKVRKKHTGRDGEVRGKEVRILKEARIVMSHFRQGRLVKDGGDW